MENIKYTAILPWEKVYERIRTQWANWAVTTNTSKFVIGISGGKDSTCCAALATKIFGKDNVVGVLMPNGIQSDIEDARKVCKELNITSIEVNIRDSVMNIANSVDKTFHMSTQATQNLPARIRMATLFAVAQSVGGKVIRTCNLSEDYVGYSTLFGDDCGAYQPLKELTCTEVMNFTEFLGFDSKLAKKVPADGLCGKSDEDNLGFTYWELDTYIRTKTWENYNSFLKFKSLEQRNKFKERIVNVPGPYLNSIINEVYPRSKTSFNF